MKNDMGIVAVDSSSEVGALLRLSWPIILSLMVQGLYNLVDSMYLARLGEKVMSAMSLCFVVQNMSTFLFTGMATGMNARLSKALGEADLSAAKRAVFNGIVVQAAITALSLSLDASLPAATSPCPLRRKQLSKTESPIYSPV